MNYYTLRDMESNSLKCSSIQMVHSIKLNFFMCIIGHSFPYCADFGEFRINSFSQEYNNNFYTLQFMESNYKKHGSV